MTPKTPDKLLSLLGIARKAGRVIIGTEMVCDEVRRRGHAGHYEEEDEKNVPVPETQSGKPHKQCGCVLIASDASANTKKRILNACAHYQVRAFVAPVTTAQLSDRLGKTGAVAAAAVFDRHFTDALIPLLEQQNTESPDQA